MLIISFFLASSVVLNVMLLIFIFRANARIHKASYIIWDMDIEVLNCYFHSKLSEADKLEKVVSIVGKACDNLKPIIPDERQIL